MVTRRIVDNVTNPPMFNQYQYHLKVISGSGLSSRPRCPQPESPDGKSRDLHRRGVRALFGTQSISHHRGFCFCPRQWSVAIRHPMLAPPVTTPLSIGQTAREQRPNERESCLSGCTAARDSCTAFGLTTGGQWWSHPSSTSMMRQTETRLSPTTRRVPGDRSPWVRPHQAELSGAKWADADQASPRGGQPGFFGGEKNLTPRWVWVDGATDGFGRAPRGPRLLLAADPFSPFGAAATAASLAVEPAPDRFLRGEAPRNQATKEMFKNLLAPTFRNIAAWSLMGFRNLLARTFLHI